MNDARNNLCQQISHLLNTQSLAVLATNNQGQPHASIVAFAAVAQLDRILIATPRATRKYACLLQEPRVALLVDNRQHSPADFHKAEALTIIGTAEEVKEEQAADIMAIYRHKHPHLAGFIAEPSCAAILIRISRYSLVTRFQQVMELII